MKKPLAKKSVTKNLLACLILSVSAAAIAQPELKGNPQELRQFLHPNDKVVTIRGQAEKKAYSDKAIVSLVITTKNKLLSTAIADNGNLRNTITTKLISAGIAEKAIKSSKFSSSPQYGWFGKKPDSYEVVNRMAISIVEENHLRKIASVADQYKEIELSNTVFEHTKKDEFSHKVKADALDKIMKQKTFYETSLGVELTPIGIRDAHILQQATRGALALEEIVVTAQKAGSASFAPSAKRKRQASTPSFDEVKYQANLAVDFKIAKPAVD